MAAGLCENKAASGQCFQFVRLHQRAAHHLQALAGIVLPPADGTGQHCAVAQRLGENVGTIGVWRKAAEQDILAIVDDNAGAFLSIVFLELRETLDNGYHTDPPGTSGAEHHLHRLNFRDGSDLISEHHDTVWQLPSMLVSDGQHLPVDLLEEQGYHKIFCVIFFRKYNKNS